MGWRKTMGVKKSEYQEQKPQKPQNTPEQAPFATIAPFAPKDLNQTATAAPPPGLSKVRPEHHKEYTKLWYMAWALADYVEGSAPTPDRLKRMPELNLMVERMRTLEQVQGSQGIACTENADH